jgi:hypothetical protein
MAVACHLLGHVLVRLGGRRMSRPRYMGMSFARRKRASRHRQAIHSQAWRRPWRAVVDHHDHIAPWSIRKQSSTEAKSRLESPSLVSLPSGEGFVLTEAARLPIGR